MLKRKRIRTRGKISMSTFFQQFQEGDRVAIVRSLDLPADVPFRMQGKTGTVLNKRGRAYVVAVRDGNHLKQYIMLPIHLRRVGLRVERAA